MRVKKLISLLLSFALVFSLMVTPTFAETSKAVSSFNNLTRNGIIEKENCENAQVFNDNSSEYPDAAITVPRDATLFVGTKGQTHFVNFEEIEPSNVENNGSSTTYYFELNNNSTYNYRISGEEYVTYAGTFKKTQNFKMSVSEEQLKPIGKSKSTVDRNTSSNNGYNVADIYLNINPEGYLKLKKDDKFQIVSLRNWEAVNSITSNYFIEPDYNYFVIDENGNPSDVVDIDKNGLLTAKKSGTAIVLVTYDAMTLNFGTVSDFYGAIYPENTGVFVVSVDSEECGIETGITINEEKNKNAIKLSGDYLDSEHDCIYYTGEQGEYRFTPGTEDVVVYVANSIINQVASYKGFSEIIKNNDDSFTIPLKEGRNIVKIEKNGKTEYQIISAKKVNITINNGEDVHRGDNVSIEFDRLYHPANKLAGVYNMNAIALYSGVSGYEGKLVGATASQYNFANNKASQNVCNVLKEKNTWGVINYVKDTDLKIPEDYPYDTFTLSGGTIYVSGWGDSFGNHRNITYETGKAPNLNADAKLAYLAELPDIEIPVVATDSEIESITLDSQNVNTSYYTGDKFDDTGLVVTANYEDGTTQIATKYSVSPEVLESDTGKVTITYRGKTEEIPVTVNEPKVTAIEITSPPTKNEYKEGETFNPTGMKVSAVYENGTKTDTKEFSYYPKRELEKSDTQMIISYSGGNGIGTVSDISQVINVSEKSAKDSVPASEKISVLFTLLGDDNHGILTGNDDIHTKKRGNLDTWISKTKVTLEKGSCVIDAIEKALSLNGIPYSNEGNYISEIKGLGEFDNGNLSGWMYTVNGKYPTKGIEEYKLSNGDEIVFHYTDDYSSEATGYSGENSSSKTKSQKEKISASNPVEVDVFDGLDGTANYLINTVTNPTVSSIGGEWTIIGLARSGMKIDNEYFKKYYDNVKEYIESKNGILHSRKNTEYSRVVIALTAIGKNPEDVAGYNIVTPLFDYEKTREQGLNGSIWALIALDSGDYGTSDIINKYIDDILKKEKSKGGWSLSDSEKNADADITAMALIALSNYKDRKNVKSAINRAVKVLSEMQNKKGGYSSNDSETSESSAQVLTALSALGISYNDKSFVKNGKSLIDNINSFRQNDGSFSHTIESNLMATEQCFYALIAAKRVKENKTSLFDMRDVINTGDSSTGLSGKNEDVKIPEIIFSGKTFNDISEHKNQSEIEKLAERGIINGMSENTFAPDNTMTRAEFAAITVRALSLPAKTVSNFTDVKTSDWYYNYVNTAYSYGIIKGVSDTKFNPNGTITLEQAATMICRAAQLCGIKNEFNDVDAINVLSVYNDYVIVSDWAKSSIAFCFENGILDKNETDIKPSESVKRCRIANMLYNLLEGAMLI